MKLRARIDRALEIILSSLMAFMILNVLWQVFSRYVIGQPSSFTDELARYLLIWLGILGASYASGKGLHLAMSLFHDKFKGKSRFRMDMFLEVLVIFFSFTLMIIGGSRLVYLTFYLGQTSSALGMPLGVVYSIIPVSGVIFIYYAIDNIINIKSKSNGVD